MVVTLESIPLVGTYLFAELLGPVHQAGRDGVRPDLEFDPANARRNHCRQPTPPARVDLPRPDITGAERAVDRTDREDNLITAELWARWR